MGKLNIFEISFANTSGIFYPGNILDGHVTIELIEPMDMRGVVLKFDGKASVDWSEETSSGIGSNRTTQRRSYTATEKYFDHDVLLYGNGVNDIQLAPGRHTFPFRFQLPLALPSSFEGGSGNVRYQVVCKIDKPWKFDHNTKRLFTVISMLDLNGNPDCVSRASGNNQKHLCCLCCKSGPISAQFCIDRKGWVPGEAIKLHADISNGSSRTMNQSYVDLKMITTFFAEGSFTKEVREVARVTRPAIEAHGEDTWTTEQLVIPPVPPSYLVGCNIIDIQYILQLNVDPSGIGFDLEVPLPIIIGTIPLISVIQETPPMFPVAPPYSQFDPPAPGLEVFYPAPPTPDIPNLPPPSYSTCITGAVDAREPGDNEYTRGNLNFAPAYTYYNWGHTPGALPDSKTQ